MSNDHNNVMEKMTDRPALTEPATEAVTPVTAMARWLFQNEREVIPGLRAIIASKVEILAVEDQAGDAAVQREREALVERVARRWFAMCFFREEWSDEPSDDPYHNHGAVQYARRLLGLDA